jgi:hypothetical protein
MLNTGLDSTALSPPVPMKLPMTARSGLKIFDSALTLP